MDVLKEIGNIGIIPVIEIDSASDAINLGSALLAGGLPFAEITFRTDEAQEAIRVLSETYPQLCVGAGSVLNVSQAQNALNAGAKYIVSPGYDIETADWCMRKQIVFIPGVSTPTEIMMALKKNLAILKFFPAEALGGVLTLKAIAAPFPGVKFIPTGGVSAENIESYLRLPIVYAVGGSWLASKKLIREKKFEEITTLTKEAISIVRNIRGVR